MVKKSYHLSSKLIFAFHCFFTALICGILGLVIFSDTRTLEGTLFPFKIKYNLLLCICWVSVFLLFLFLIKLKEHWLCRYEPWIVIIGLGIYFAALIFIGHSLEVSCGGDVKAVLYGSRSLAENGTLGDYEWYFYKYSNNLGGAFAFALWQVLTPFIKDFSFSRLILNSLAITITLAIVWYTTRSAAGIKWGLFSLFIMMCCTPLYLYAAVYYTDTIAMPFVSGGGLAYLLALKSASKRRQTIYIILCGLLLGIGMCVKMSTGVMLTAILLHITFSGKRKGKLRLIILLLISAGICLAGMKRASDKILSDRVLYEQKNMPVSHWIMMGLKGDGRYNGKDEKYTYSFQNRSTASKRAWRRAWKRIHKYGFAGMAKHLVKKTQFSFGDGTFNVSCMLDDGVLRPNILHQYILLTSPGILKFFYWSNGYYAALLLFILAGCIKDFIHNQAGLCSGAFLMRLSFFGIWSFLMLWESNSRLVVSYLPVIIICGVLPLGQCAAPRISGRKL